MTKVTLLGDSIRIGYGKLVPDMLGDNYTVFQPAENCRFSKYTLRGIFDWRNDIEGSDIIHWNNGLWDCTPCVDGNPFTDIDEYVKNMLRIAGLLKEKAKVVIFATTTPVNDNVQYDKNSLIKEYNKVIVSELTKLGIRINDLHSLVYPNIDKYICEDNLHMNEQGYEVIAKQVVDAIKEAEASLR